MISPIIDDIRLFNKKTFRDPLSNNIEINTISTHKFPNFPKSKGKFSVSLYDGDEEEFIKIWDSSIKSR